MKIHTSRCISFFCVALLCSACSSQLRYPEPPQTAVARVPVITTDKAAGTATMEITVLIYNVAGLPWPAGCGKASRDTDDSGKRGTEPDIILIQEAFISASAEIPVRGGYSNWVAGPGRKDLGAKYSERASEAFIAERSFWKGEKLGKLQSSGLLLASKFPIVELYNHPFNQWECGGIDCLANKGLLVAELQIPGLPDHLAIATTHYNARGASGVSAERSLTAHNLQVAESDEFLRSLNKGYLPFIWGGDINMRHALVRNPGLAGLGLRKPGKRHSV